MATRKGTSTRSSSKAHKGEKAKVDNPADRRMVKSRAPRTATGKRANPERLAAAQAEAQDFLRERTEEGHRAAGRVPPSQRTERRTSGAARKVDDDLRDLVQPVTEDEKLLALPATDRRGSRDFTPGA
jgi:hypothetical protein